MLAFIPYVLGNTIVCYQNDFHLLFIIVSRTKQLLGTFSDSLFRWYLNDSPSNLLRTKALSRQFIWCCQLFSCRLLMPCHSLFCLRYVKTFIEKHLAMWYHLPWIPFQEIMRLREIAIAGLTSLLCSFTLKNTINFQGFSFYTLHSSPWEKTVSLVNVSGYCHLQDPTGNMLRLPLSAWLFIPRQMASRFR